MSNTKIADVVVPEKFSKYVLEESVIKNDFYQSGVITTNSQLQGLAGSGGRTVTVPTWRNPVYTTGDANISSDDETVNATPSKVSAFSQVAAISHLNQGWSSSDLTYQLAGENPLGAVQTVAGEYWNNQAAKRLMATVEGMRNQDLKAGSTNDMSYPISDDSIVPVSALNFTLSAKSLGDNKKSLRAVAMHPDTVTELMIADQIVYIKPSEGSMVQLPTYQGLLVIEDEKCPVETISVNGTDTQVYTSILLGANLFGAAAGLVPNPVSVERKEAAGNGAGVEALWSRISMVMHPTYYKWLGTNQAGVSPTLAELKDADNWKREATDRREVPIVFYRHSLDNVGA